MSHGEAMGGTIVTICAIVLVAILLVLVPLLNQAEGNENMVQHEVRVMAEGFLDRTVRDGAITLASVEQFILDLHATANTFDIQIEVLRLDENPGKKVVITTSDAIGENLTITEFTSQIMEQLENTHRYDLDIGDTVTVSVSNTNRTMGDTLRNFFTPGTGGSSRINASATRMITQ
ncbi:MAG: hypothetical protein FWC68_04950 [Oscillospiraceae bacterium]|nr:hypothetical protein [Oscillospiraceae bacterium]